MYAKFKHTHVCTLRTHMHMHTCARTHTHTVTCSWSHAHAHRDTDTCKYRQCLQMSISVLVPVNKRSIGRVPVSCLKTCVIQWIYLKKGNVNSRTHIYLLLSSRVGLHQFKGWIWDRALQAKVLTQVREYSILVSVDSHSESKCIKFYSTSR